MTEKLSFSKRSEFIKELEKLLKSGISPKKIRLYLPHSDHEVDHLMEQYVKPSKLKYFTLTGALIGLIGGFWFTIWASLSWPIMTGGKPVNSIPAFIVIAFELTILIGAMASFNGFLVLSKKPDFRKILFPEDHGNEYVILIDREDKE